MARNTYTLDGIPLTDPEGRWFLDKESGLRVIPAKRMPNISYPGVDGDSFTPGGSYLAGAVRVVMYVEGTDHEDFMKNVEFLNGLFLQRHKLLELRHDYDIDGNESRHAFVKFASSTEINFFGTGVKQGTLEYMAEIPGVFWRSAADSLTSIEAYPTTPTVNFVNGLTGGNAPVDDALIRVKGGFSQLLMQDFTTGSQLIFNTAIADNEYVLVDPKNWTAYKMPIAAWDGREGGTDVSMSVISNRGYGSMFIMEPSIFGDSLAYRLIYNTVNPVGSPRIDILAKKSYI